MHKLYFFLIFSFQIYGFVLKTTSAECSQFKWQCDNKQCINYEDRCDGKKDCLDGSDETFQHCIHLSCPAYAFHCAYGACIADSMICNNHDDCADGSDETKLLCDPTLQNDTAIRNYLRGGCKGDLSLECEPGECIDIDKKCDGKRDCEHGFDESLTLCSNNYCQPYAFRCAYGGCIRGTARCDGKADCADGSDETPELCNPIKEPEFCDLPPKQAVLVFEQLNVNGVMSEAKRLSYGATLKFSCKEGWKLLGSKYSTCKVSGWSNPFPHCTKYCPNHVLQRDISTKAICSQNEREISCKGLLPIGTIARINCRPGYIFNEKEVAPLSDAVRCNTNGEWNTSKRKCSPKCGIVERLQGEEMPWDVSIYRLLGVHYKHQCYGTVVSPKIVISAETCFSQIKTSDIDEHEWYNIVGGKYDEDYKSSTDIHRPVFNVSEIYLTSSLHATDNIAIIVLVNYFEFSSSLAPICLQFQRFSTAPYAKLESSSNNTRNSGEFGGSISQIYRTNDKDVHFLIAVSKRNANAKPIALKEFESFIKKYVERYNYLL